jgi:hypothetical protein
MPRSAQALLVFAWRPGRSLTSACRQRTPALGTSERVTHPDDLLEQGSLHADAPAAPGCWAPFDPRQHGCALLRHCQHFCDLGDNNSGAPTLVPAMQAAQLPSSSAAAAAAARSAGCRGGSAGDQNRRVQLQLWLPSPCIMAQVCIMPLVLKAHAASQPPDVMHTRHANHAPAAAPQTHTRARRQSCVGTRRHIECSTAPQTHNCRHREAWGTAAGLLRCRLPCNPGTALSGTASKLSALLSLSLWGGWCVQFTLRCSRGRRPRVACIMRGGTV